MTEQRPGTPARSVHRGEGGRINPGRCTAIHLRQPGSTESYRRRRGCKCRQRCRGPEPLPGWPPSRWGDGSANQGSASRLPCPNTDAPYRRRQQRSKPNTTLGQVRQHRRAPAPEPAGFPLPGPHAQHVVRVARQVRLDARDQASEGGELKSLARRQERHLDHEARAVGNRVCKVARTVVTDHAHRHFVSREAVPIHQEGLRRTVRSGPRQLAGCYAPEPVLCAHEMQKGPMRPASGPVRSNTAGHQTYRPRGRSIVALPSPPPTRPTSAVSTPAVMQVFILDSPCSSLERRRAAATVRRG